MLNLDFQLKPSRRYLIFLGVIFLTTLLVFFSLALPWWLMPLGSSLLIAYESYILWQFGLLQGKHAIQGLRRNSEGEWYIQTKQAFYLAALQMDSLVTPMVCILRFRVNKKTAVSMSCVICRDSLEPDLYRRLIVALKNG